MAFFFLFTGLLMGGALISLSESEREYYDQNRVLMSFLGNKDGYDIYKDPTNNTFYVDDGWDVRRVGSHGFVPHPVDKERLQQLCTKYNPENLRWVEFLLASYEGKEQSLWQSFFEKYELGAKPKEPTWGKGIRKARWADYQRQEDEWEARKRELTPKFQEECRKWNERRQAADAEYQDRVSKAAGSALLQRALSSQVIYPPMGGAVLQPAMTTTYQTTIPAGLRAGETFLAKAGGQTVSVTVPPNAYPGMPINFVAASSPPPVVQVVAQPVRPTAAPPPAPVPVAVAPPPPAITGNSAQAAAPPPAIGASPPKTLEAKSSMIW